VTAEPRWARHAIFWRVYPLGFVGAFPQPAAGPAVPGEHRLRRVIGWLDHAVALGASGIALGPIFASSTHGYDTIDHLRLDPRLGDEDDFDELVGEAHRRGLRVQLDGVFNHVSREHPRVLAALADGAGDPSAWFRVSAGADGQPVLETFEGHHGLVALNHASPTVRDYVVEVLCHWLDRGADAWRLDAAYAVPREFWAEVLPRVRAAHPGVHIEAEVIHGAYADFVAASTVDAVTQYELWKAIWSSINDRNFHELNWALSRHNQLLASFAPATFVGNHDVTRIASQIADRRHLPHAIALLALLGGTPTIYAGDEFGMRGIKENRAGGDDAIRPEFPACPTELPGRDMEILRLHQLLLGLRRRHPWLHRAISATTHLGSDHLGLRLAANGSEAPGDGGGADALLLDLNLSDQARDLPPGAGVLLADRATTSALPGGHARVAPHGWAVTADAGR